MESGSGFSSNNSIVVANQSKPLLGIRIENPFTFKVFQVFTGFGFGCGVGIGVGRPVNLGISPFSLCIYAIFSRFLSLICSLRIRICGNMKFWGLFKPKNGETHLKSLAISSCKQSFDVLGVFHSLSSVTCHVLSCQDNLGN